MILDTILSPQFAVIFTCLRQIHSEDDSSCVQNSITIVFLL